MEIRVCNNDDCDWVGYEGDTVHPKHAESLSLCPECKETTEEITPSWFKELLQDKEDAERWRAFLSSKRIRIIGSAGIGDENYQHFGMEIWSDHQVDDAEYGRELITKYADAIRSGQ